MMSYAEENLRHTVYMEGAYALGIDFTPSSCKETLSIAALKANLHYYERLKQKAFDEHKAAIIKAHEAMTALNNALLRECSRG